MIQVKDRMLLHTGYDYIIFSLCSFHIFTVAIMDPPGEITKDRVWRRSKIAPHFFRLEHF
jgi:hypothetical protein